MLIAVSIKIGSGPKCTTLKDNEIVAPVNNIVHSLFEDVKVRFNETPVTAISQGFGLKSVMETIISSEANSKVYWLQSQGFYEDDYSNMDAVTGNG